MRLYSGCGNRFILLDERVQKYPIQDRQRTQTLCLEYAVDGIILLDNSSSADFKMTTLNADGGEAEMCGNGLRCLGRFITDIGFPNKFLSIATKKAILSLSIEGEKITAQMPKPHSFQWNIPLFPTVHFLNTGVPHVVYFVENIATFNLEEFGKRLLSHPQFQPEGTNVTIAQLGDPIKIRTFERGVNRETLACGTGATAVAIATSYLFKKTPPFSIQVESGDRIQINFNADFSNVTMTGEAHEIRVDQNSQFQYTQEKSFR